MCDGLGADVRRMLNVKEQADYPVQRVAVVRSYIHILSDAVDFSYIVSMFKRGFLGQIPTLGIISCFMRRTVE